MGNEQVQPSSIGEQSGFQKYLLEMERLEMTEIAPFRNPEILYLKKVFSDIDYKKNGSIEVDDFDSFYHLREHPLYERIRTLIRQQMQKIKVKRISFDIMLYLLSVFHIETEIQAKYRYLFRLYDWDHDFKLNLDDLVQTFQILFYGPMYTDNAYHSMAQYLISKHGQNGFIKFQSFIRMVPERQINELMTLKFLEL